MSYCGLEDIQRLLKWFTFSASSKITSSEVTSYFIPEADKIIDSKLQRVYTVPITDSDDIEIIKFISCRIVACEISHVLVLQSSGEISPIVNRWCEQAKEKLDAILTQDILLPNSTLLDDSGDSGGRLYSFTAHGSDTLGKEAPDPIWYSDTDQW
jgi:hypothetical protein